MTKVVINTCFGGFGLSPEGMAAYLARKGETAYFYEEDRSSGGVGERDYVRLDQPVQAAVFGPTCVVRDFGPRATKDEIWKSGAYRSSSGVVRDDPDLAAVVETLGEKAGDWAANLRVVEVPDDAAWEIAEYDGKEHVAEQHRTWE